MPQLQGTSSSSGGRLDGSLQRTTLAASHFTVGAGWGTEAVLAITTGSTDQRGKFTVTASTTGVAQATATVVITFADGAWAAAPFCVVTTTNNNSIDTGHVTWSSTTTALTLTFSLLPVDTKVYTFTYACIA
jgi:hypothetical protein